MELELLYAKLVEQNFEGFKTLYEQTPNAYQYHDKLICTAYRKQFIANTDRRYHQFVRYFADKKLTVQLLCLMANQDYNQVVEYFDKLSHEEKNIALSFGSPLLDIAIHKQDKKLIMHLVQYMQPSAYLYPVMSSNFEEIKYSVVNRLEKTKENSLYIITLYLDKAIKGEACLNYLAKYHNFDNIDISDTQYHSYSRIKSYKHTRKSITEMSFNAQLNNLLTGTTQWYDTLFNLNTFEYNISDQAQNIYLKVSLEENLEDKKNQKMNKI